MDLKTDLKKALQELRKSKERKFDETVDLIINLQKFDVKRTAVNIFVNVPNKIKDKKVAGFLESQNKNIDTITPDQFKKYNNKKALKKLVDKYDFFIAQASIMPKVATTFGRVLGPAGKMPSPQQGIILNADDKTIADLKSKINTSIRIRVKEASVKVPAGKRSMSDENIVDNIITIYNSLIKEFPRNIENIKNVEVKFTMTKPIKIRIR